MFWLFAMGGRLRAADSDSVLREFEEQLTKNYSELWQVYGVRTSPTSNVLYKLYAAQLTGPSHHGWYKFEFDAAYLGAAKPYFDGPLSVAGDLDLLTTFTADHPGKIGLWRACQMIKSQLQKRGLDVVPLKSPGTLRALRDDG